MSATMLVGLSLTRASVPYCWRFLGAALSISGPNRTLRTSCPTFSGHNKWSKVKNIKGPKDLERSRIFQKLSMMIRLTVREGGPNPDLNRHLANVIEQCRSKNMPKASIEAAISGGDKAKASSHLLYGVRGPGGSCLLVEVLADNTTRFLNRLRYLLNRHGLFVPCQRCTRSVRSCTRWACPLSPPGWNSFPVSPSSCRTRRWSRLPTCWPHSGNIRTLFECTTTSCRWGETGAGAEGRQGRQIQPPAPRLADSFPVPSRLGQRLWFYLRRPSSASALRHFHGVCPAAEELLVPAPAGCPG
uniref:Translational activator of cytochrome c oxidase I n=1 Tax=Sphenodon punctatus TaxID=8508 RepID=A0A8D0HRP2_SPHPU